MHYCNNEEGDGLLVVKSDRLREIWPRRSFV